jgi:hypothetical protein
MVWWCHLSSRIKTLSRLECKNMLQINFGLMEKYFVTVTFACWNDINNRKRGNISERKKGRLEVNRQEEHMNKVN